MLDAISKAFNQLYATPDELPTDDYICRQLRIPNDVYWLGVVNELLSRLGFVESWKEDSGAVTPEQAAAIGAEMFHEYVTSECNSMIGAIIPAVRAAPNPNWLLCDGSWYDAVNYPELYSVLDVKFKVPETNQFFVPDLRERFLFGGILNSAWYDGNAYVTGGEAAHQLTVAEMPAHTHTPATQGESFVTTSTTLNTGRVLATATGTNWQRVFGGETTGSRGGSVPHNNMPPYMTVLYYLIAR